MLHISNNLYMFEEKRGAIRERCFIMDVDETIAFEASKIEHSLSWGLGDSIICVTARLMAAEVLARKGAQRSS